MAPCERPQDWASSFWVSLRRARACRSRSPNVFTFVIETANLNTLVISTITFVFIFAYSMDEGRLMADTQENRITMQVTHLFEQVAEQRSGTGSRLSAELLQHGFTVRLHHELATLYRALSQPHPVVGSEVVLVHATLPVAVRLTRELRRYSESVPVIALPRSVSQEGLLLAMQAGIDACWPAEVPLSLLAESLSRLQSRSTPGQPLSAAAPAAWALVAR